VVCTTASAWSHGHCRLPNANARQCVPMSNDQGTDNVGTLKLSAWRKGQWKKAGEGLVLGLGRRTAGSPPEACTARVEGPSSRAPCSHACWLIVVPNSRSTERVHGRHLSMARICMVHVRRPFH
jgi:hypothetical protein